jgi:propionyl-CoA synthetase
MRRHVHPTAFRAIKKEDPQGKFFAQYDLTRFRTLFLAGERADPDTLSWAEKLLKRPVIDHWWQTETGWAIAGNPVGLGALRQPGRGELSASVPSDACVL